MPPEMFGDVILTSDVPSEGCVLAMSARSLERHVAGWT